jgi:hypothetical protein
MRSGNARGLPCAQAWRQSEKPVQDQLEQNVKDITELESSEHCADKDPRR